MNGTRRLVGSFNHGTMANALPHANGAQASQPGRQVLHLAGSVSIRLRWSDDVLTWRMQPPEPPRAAADGFSLGSDVDGAFSVA